MLGLARNSKTIGWRSGIHIDANKIRRDKDGFENIDDYFLSDSDSDSSSDSTYCIEEEIKHKIMKKQLQSVAELGLTIKQNDTIETEPRTVDVDDGNGAGDHSQSPCVEITIAHISPQTSKTPTTISLKQPTPSNKDSTPVQRHVYQMRRSLSANLRDSMREQTMIQGNQTPELGNVNDSRPLNKLRMASNRKSSIPSLIQRRSSKGKNSTGKIKPASLVNRTLTIRPADKELPHDTGGDSQVIGGDSQVTGDGHRSVGRRLTGGWRKSIRSVNGKSQRKNTPNISTHNSTKVTHRLTRSSNKSTHNSTKPTRNSTTPAANSTTPAANSSKSTHKLSKSVGLSGRKKKVRKDDRTSDSSEDIMLVECEYRVSDASVNQSKKKSVTGPVTTTITTRNNDRKTTDSAKIKKPTEKKHSTRKKSKRPLLTIPKKLRKKKNYKILETPSETGDSQKLVTRKETVTQQTSRDSWLASSGGFEEVGQSTMPSVLNKSHDKNKKNKSRVKNEDETKNTNNDGLSVFTPMRYSVAESQSVLRCHGSISKKSRVSFHDTNIPDELRKPNMYTKPVIIPPTTGAPGLRRSKRHRVRPLQNWRLERLKYIMDGSHAVLQVTTPTLDEDMVRQLKRKHDRFLARKPKKQKIDFLERKKRKLSIHKAMPKATMLVKDPQLAVINTDTKDEVLIDGVVTSSMLQFNTEHDNGNISLCRIFNQPMFACGLMSLASLADKKMASLKQDSLVYHIIEGKLAVNIHRTTMLLEAGDHFIVPQGNCYSMINLRDEKAVLYYFQLKGQ